MSNAGISRAKTTGEHKFVNARARTFHPQATQQRILCTTEDLHQCLYKQNEVVFLSKEDFRTSLQQKEEVHSYWCKGCHQERTEQCQLHAPHQTLKITTTVNNNNNTNNTARLPNAVESFPNEVGLCISSIPGAGYGVCAKQTIPLGTWIGPYEGELVRPEEVLLGADASYMWEIFHEGKLLYYIDGRDENKSSWMRYIRCARHPHEQNMFAFQYCGNIYYRAFKDIPPKTELLVWYDDKYPQYMGIPLEIYEASPGKTVDPRQQPDMVVVVPRDASNPATSYPYQPPPRPLTDRLQPLPSLQLTQQGPSPPSRVQSRDQSRTKRTLTQSISLGSENLHQPITTQAYKRVRRVSWANDSLPLPINSQVIDSSTEDTRFVRDTQAATARSGVVRNIQTNGHHDNTPLKELCDDRSKKPLTTAEERQPRSGDEEGSSSDGSDASFFNCGQCGKSFAQRSVLQIHVCPNMPHKPYHCGHCEQSFDNPNELRTHAVIHVGEKPFKCGYCSRSFAGATTLHNHVRTHTGEKPFTCERCGKNFSQASQLHKHEGIPGDCVPYNNLPD